MLQQLRKGRDEGFTLIELLIVVIVLGILAAIVLFALGTFKGDSVQASCKTDGKSVETALAAYIAKHGTVTAGNDYTQIVPTYLKHNPDTTNYTFSWDSSGNVTAAYTSAAGSITPANCMA